MTESVVTMNKCIAIASLLAMSLFASFNLQAQEPIVGLPCEGCEAVFQGLPEGLPTQARIALEAEPGQPMRVSGQVFGADGKPRAGVVIYAYQTNAAGVYPRSANPSGQAADRHGALRAWVQTDADGVYRFATIRPASYPNQSIPAHIHLHVIEPNCATYYIDDITFSDDPLLTPSLRSRKKARAGNGLTTPNGSAAGWEVSRDIQLGLNIPGYPECGGGSTIR
ncbi:MAG: dioxygenase family protein [Pseudomarimonas sp.]